MLPSCPDNSARFLPNQSEPGPTGGTTKSESTQPSLQPTRRVALQDWALRDSSSRPTALLQRPPPPSYDDAVGAAPPPSYVEALERIRSVFIFAAGGDRDGFASWSGPVSQRGLVAISVTKYMGLNRHWGPPDMTSALEGGGVMEKRM